jgi:hypothetical protein
MIWLAIPATTVGAFGLLYAIFAGVLGTRDSDYRLHPDWLWLFRGGKRQ